VRQSDGMVMTEPEIQAVVEGLVAQVGVDAKRIVVVVPDGTRSAPVATMARLIDAALGARAASVLWLVALGTHQPMDADALARHVGPVAGQVRNHEWWDPDQLVSVGIIPAPDVGVLTGGRLIEDIDVRINRAVVEADAAIVCGPVFPHEVVGFSGGNKYFFPGVAGEEIIDATHWLGALITSSDLIGTLGVTPVRAVIDTAAALIPTERWCLAMVVAPGTAGLEACVAGRPEAAWAAAARVSSEVHIRRLAAPVRTVLSIMPARYADLWTAAKGMYKVEPVVADGGEVIIYAPHVKVISVTHGELLAEVGYHVRDYFVGQWDRFGGYPGSILAHSTHVTGLGTWSAEQGERRRITVTLATGIDEDTCLAHNLGYRDPASIDVAAWTATAERDPDLLVVPDAGELLFRLETVPAV
jgi:nickel-dependent lactate racemase